MDGYDWNTSSCNLHACEASRTNTHIIWMLYPYYDGSVIHSKDSLQTRQLRIHTSVRLQWTAALPNYLGVMPTISEASRDKYRCCTSATTEAWYIRKTASVPNTNTTVGMDGAATKAPSAWHLFAREASGDGRVRQENVVPHLNTNVSVDDNIYLHKERAMAKMVEVQTPRRTQLRIA